MNTIRISPLSLLLSKTFLFSTFLILSIGSNAQFINFIGLKSGVVVSNQTWEYSSGFDRDLKNRTGINITFITEMFSSKYFSFCTDLGYIQKGSVERMDIRDENNNHLKTIDVNYRYDFLYIAPQAKFKLPIQNFTPYALIGPRMDYFIHSKYDSEFAHLSNDLDFNNFVFGINYGLGIQYDFEVFTIFLEGQYQQDISKFLNVEPSSQNIGVEISNSAWLVNLGLAYKFGG